MLEKSRLYLIFCLATLIFAGFVPFAVKQVYADQWFDRYGNISWQDERAHLANFAVYLQQHAEKLGYIASCSVDKNARAKARKRLKSAKKYLMSEFKLPAERIRIVFGQKCVENTTILEPLDKGSPPMKFF
jgi:hypothetical protein